MQPQDKSNGKETGGHPASSQHGDASLPAINAPKGGGAIRGQGEKFGANPATGSGSMSVPLATSPGRAGFGPQLSLSYDSGSGNGPFGFGWTLSLPAITRKTDKGLPRYHDGEESDTFILAGSEDLVPVLDGAGQRVSTPRTVHNVAYRIHPYRPRIEGLFARIERWTRVEDGVSHWRMITRDNVTTLFGFDENSRIRDPRDERRVYSYLIHLTFDDRGHATHYVYAPEDSRGVALASACEANRTEDSRGAQRYLKRVRYGNIAPFFPDWSEGGPELTPPADWHFQVVFDYGDHREQSPASVPDRDWPVRPDPFSIYRAGFEVRTYRRCERVLLFHQFAGQAGFEQPTLVRSTDLLYSDEVAPADERNPVYTFLQSVTQTGYRRRGAEVVRRSNPPLEFFYSQPEVHPEVLTLNDAESRAGLPEGLDGTRFRWLDLDGEGLPGILSEHNGGWHYKRNLSPVNEVTLAGGERVARARFGPLEAVPKLPAPAGLRSGQQLLDLEGVGRLQLVAFDAAMPGYFSRTDGEDWEPFRPFRSLPEINWSDPNLKFVDLTGDGRADLLVTEDGVFTFYPSRGTEGYGAAERVPVPWDEERGPRVVFADGTQTVTLADMTGDGLSDIVRVRAGEVCYWPNLGYGRFGAKVSMDNAPRFADEERFEPRRLRFADIDGSGTTDLFYVGEDGVRVCFNRSGNSWAEPRRLAVFPGADALSDVQVTDLLGTGTACLVWSSPLPAESYAALRYVDLMGSQKPHLLVRTRNNLGAETRVRFAPSTRFYLEDKLAGRPWITKLPHVVHVVERVETFDWIGRSRFVTRYRYHHGYFDSEEREFRGFGMVEQWDTEEHRTETAFPEGEDLNWNAASWVPPVCTRTWFHTGAFAEGEAISRQYAHEYWVEPALRPEARADDRAAMLLPDTVLPPNLGPEETREAVRALKGQTLRVEVYAEDGTARAEHPYTVTEQNFTVRSVQAKGPNRYAVFHTHQRESVSFHYERNPGDPRVTHDVTLRVDEYGNELNKVTVGYPRRPGQPAPEPTLSAAYRGMLAYDQSRLRVSATGHAMTEALVNPALLPDAHRTPQPAESISAEFYGLKPLANRPGITNLFTFSELEGHWLDLWGGARDIPYEVIPSADVDGTGVPTAAPKRRIVDRTRTLYRRDDLTALLALGELQPLALPGESYQLALTPSHVARIFDDLVPDATLTEGGYVQLAGTDGWWMPSGRVFYSAGDDDAPGVERAEARAHFFRPRRALDAFGARTRVAYDAYDLLPVTFKDPVGNTTTAANDYRVLQPSLITDVNGNQVEAAFDALGMVVGTASMGKPGENLGDTLAGFEPDIDEATLLAHLADPLADPASILVGATSRMLYDVAAYQRTRDNPQPSPPAVYTLARETHVSALAPGEQTRYHHSFSYSDGFGRAAQQKAQAAPGPVAGGDAIVTPRWLATGWTIYDNKGNAVRAYEPFYTATHRFEFAQLSGVSSVRFFDPQGRNVATLHPNDTWEKVVFDAWRQETWDANDTASAGDPRADADVGERFRRHLGAAPGAFTSWHDRRIGGAFGATPEERAAEQDAAQKTEAHAATQAVTHLDSLGRTCLTVTSNGPGARHPSRTALDAEGKPLAVFDALGRRVFEFCRREAQAADGFSYITGYDLAGRELFHNGMDGGARRRVVNVANNMIRAWDARGHAYRVRYDPMQRATHNYVRTDGGPEILLERLVYGEGMPALNLCARLFRHYDSAGVAVSERYDFKGNLLQSTRQLAREYRKAVDWLPLENLTAAALDAAAAPLLVADDRFTSSTTFDAFDRPVQVVTPHGAGMRPNVLRPSYNLTKQLERLDVWVRRAAAPASLLDPATADLRAVRRIEYNARGQRTSTTLGNSTVTTHTYDPLTFRLTRLRTTRPDSFPADERVVQDLNYTYDAVGNVTRLRDTADTQNVVYFRNQRVEPTNDFTYDAVYRLTRATGREHLGQNGGVLEAPQQVTADEAFRTRIPHRGDGLAMGTYAESYTYDAVGNLLTMLHEVSSGTWLRRYAYEGSSRITPAEGSNRLTSTSQPGDPADGPFSAVYRYDEHGSMVRMPHLPLLTWDERDRLRSTTQQVVGDGTPVTTYYVYEAGGRRLRKVTDNEAAPGMVGVRRSERLYLGGFEIYREFAADGTTVTLARETLEVLAGQERVALVETRTVGADPAPAQLIRYQYTNHLGSAALELDADAAVITYEEYFPFGGTSYQAVRSQTETPKRYRYTGKERDEESDLYYHGARYYAPWLGRWTSRDRVPLADGPNSYAYCRNNPVNHFDPNGNEGFLSNALEVVKGVGDGIGNLASGVGNMVAHPIDTVSAVGGAMSQAYRQEGGGISGVVMAANQLNPAYHAMVAGYETYQAAQRGDYRGAGREGFNTVFQTASTVAVAVGGAGLVSRGLGLGARGAAGTAGTAAQATSRVAATAENAVATTARGASTTARTVSNATTTVRAATGAARAAAPRILRVGTGEDLITVAQETGGSRPLVFSVTENSAENSVTLGYIHRGPATMGHNIVGITTEGQTSWFHLNAAKGGLGRFTMANPAGEAMFTTTLEVTPEAAARALSAAEGGLGLGPSVRWTMFGNNCATTAGTVLQQAGVSVPVWARTPFLLQAGVRFGTEINGAVGAAAMGSLSVTIGTGGQGRQPQPQPQPQP